MRPNGSSRPAWAMAGANVATSTVLGLTARNSRWRRAAVTSPSASTRNVRSAISITEATCPNGVTHPRCATRTWTSRPVATRCSHAASTPDPENVPEPVNQPPDSDSHSRVTTAASWFGYSSSMSWSPMARTRWRWSRWVGQPRELIGRGGVQSSAGTVGS